MLVWDAVVIVCSMLPQSMAYYNFQPTASLQEC